ncbi:hypothetical protein C8Q74DRAFT_1295634 [Fomes fomentarius]|nr:hypothetical protein C8Q74DRAFT_1295634 [Fomes fomentarius]
MPVTFKVASHHANVLKSNPYPKPKCAHDIVKMSCQDQSTKVGMILDSSVNDEELEGTVPVSNGFVHAMLTAYGSHHHLRIRPDDVWLAILIQLSFYVGAHAEELRSYFVAHDGQKTLRIKSEASRRDRAHMAREFASLIHENVVDSTLVEWILPDFTTTTLKDRTISSVVMMSTLKHYFIYEDGITCGIPSVTLEGTKSDWEDIHRRLWRLYELGPEPSVWADMLRPILRRFVDAFDGKPDIEFWNHIAYRDGSICGQDNLSGWITAFCVWSSEGKWIPQKMPAQIPTQPSIPPPSVAESTPSQSQMSEGGRKTSTGRSKRFSKLLSRWVHKGAPEEVEVATSEEQVMQSTSTMLLSKYGQCESYTLDGVEYFTLDVSGIPAGFCEVEVVIDDDGMQYPHTMIAGHVAFSFSSKDGARGQLDTVSPSAHWFMYKKATR